MEWWISSVIQCFKKENILSCIMMRDHMLPLLRETMQRNVWPHVWFAMLFLTVRNSANIFRIYFLQNLYTKEKRYFNICCESSWTKNQQLNILMRLTVMVLSISTFNCKELHRSVLLHDLNTRETKKVWREH